MNPAAAVIALAGLNATALAPFDVGTFFGGITLESLAQAAGLGLLVFLFGTDRILTKGQHERRVADIVAAHVQLLSERQARMDDLKASRDYHRDTAKVESDRADRLAEQLREVTLEASRTIGMVVGSIETAAGEVVGDAQP